MAANPKDPRTKRRQAVGDDPNRMSVAPQPIPGMPQGKGNMMNYPAEDVAGQMGQRMGSGPYQFPYGDLGQGMGPAVEPVGFTENSGLPQFMVPGRQLNSNNMQPQPDPAQMAELEPMYEMASAEGLTMPGGINNGQPVSYNVTPMGPTGFSASPAPGAMPAEMQYSMPDSLPLQGGDSMGMSMGRGGGRNQQA
jgi:hypothetical protein